MTANEAVTIATSDAATNRRSTGTRRTATPETDHTPGSTSDESEVAVTEILELLGDEYVCDILRALEGGSMAARDIADACGMSRATVYRRLDRLTDAGLVSARMRVCRDGHHRQRFELVLDELRIAVDEDGIDGRLLLADSSAD